MIFFYEKKVLFDFLFFFRLKCCSFRIAGDMFQYIYMYIISKYWNLGLMETYKYFPHVQIDPG